MRFYQKVTIEKNSLTFIFKQSKEKQIKRTSYTDELLLSFLFIKESF